MCQLSDYRIHSYNSYPAMYHEVIEIINKLGASHDCGGYTETYRAFSSFFLAPPL